MRAISGGIHPFWGVSALGTNSNGTAPTNSEAIRIASRRDSGNIPVMNSETSTAGTGNAGFAAEFISTGSLGMPTSSGSMSSGRFRMTSSFSRRQRFSLVESCSLVSIVQEKTQDSHYRLAIA
jgi:hypothetical protein